MKKIYRRMLLFSSLVSFLAIAPLVVLYAIGYRASLSSVDPIPVGVIILETKPKHALVTAEGKDYGKTPTSLPNMIAGTADVSVKLPGYVEWKKQVPVEPGRATELRDIILFPEKVTPRAISQDVAAFSLSPDNEFIAVAGKDRTFSILDVAGQTVSAPQALSFTPQSLLWSPNSTMVLVTAADQTRWLYDSSRPAAIIKIPALSRAAQVAWDPRTPGRLLYVDQQGRLSAYTVFSATMVVLHKNVTSFALSDRYVFAVDAAGSVAIYTLSGASAGVSLPDPAGLVKNIIVSPGGRMAFLMKDSSLKVVNEDSTVALAADTALSASWSGDNRLLLVATDNHSLHVYNATGDKLVLPPHELKLIVRLSRPITEPKWFAGNHHLAYQTQDELMITEIDTRDRPITWQLDSTNLGSAHFSFTGDGAAAFYLKQSEGPTNLIAAPLTAE